MPSHPAPCPAASPPHQTGPLPPGAPGEASAILQALEQAIRDPSLTNRLAAIGAMRCYLSTREGMLDDLDA